MDIRQKRMSIMMVSVAFVLAMTAVTASPWILNTPLYTVRMEQASSRMNFLPYEKNGFVYTAEEGYILNYDAQGCCNGPVPFATYPETACSPPCEPTEAGDTCQQQTCPYTYCNTCSTCPNTCPNTCPYTCPNTCSTCFTCGGYTCKHTCEDPECQYTSEYTCPDTCFDTCWPTCRFC